MFGKQSIGTWCRRGAWLVVVLAVVEMVLLIISRYTAYPFLNSGGDSLQSYYLVMLILQPALSIAASTVFMFLLLYAIGIACDHFFGRAAPLRPALPVEEADEVI
jgi:uncharacterized membrane protein